MQIDVVRLGMALILADAVLLFFGGWIALAGAPSFVLGRLFELDVENALAVWYTSSKLLLVALLLAMTAFVVGRRGWPDLAILAVAGFVLAMSCDETASLHELAQVVVAARMGGGSAASEGGGMATALVVVPAMLAGLVLLAWAVRAMARCPDGKGMLAAGFAMIMAGGVGVDLLRGAVAQPYLADQVLPFVEESLEILGGTVMLVGAARVLASVAALTLRRQHQVPDVGYADGLARKARP
jgi:hypothetical protein